MGEPRQPFSRRGFLAGSSSFAVLSNIFDDLTAQVEKMHKVGVPADVAADQYVIPDSLEAGKICGAV